MVIFDMASEEFTSLLKENEELKKQLEKDKNKYIKRCKELFAEGIDVDPEDLYMAELEQRAMDCELMEMQQKEFIKYLEDIVNEINNTSADNIYQQIEKDGYLTLTNEILSKYKEIIGDNKK